MAALSTLSRFVAILRNPGPAAFELALELPSLDYPVWLITPVQCQKRKSQVVSWDLNKARRTYDVAHAIVFRLAVEQWHSCNREIDLYYRSHSTTRRRGGLARLSAAMSNPSIVLRNVERTGAATIDVPAPLAVKGRVV